MTKPPANPDGIGATIKRAFKWHWHLLGLAAAAGIALLSGNAGMWLPVVAAAEVGYMGMLGLNPRFQAILKLQERGRSSGAPPDPATRFQQLMSFLSPGDVRRFESLRQRCAELLDLRRRMDARQESGVDDFRGESLDRMLWLFLKLLHQRSGLERFLAATQRSSIESELRTAEDQLKATAITDKSAGLSESRLATSIKERISTIRERLENHLKAAESLELVASEIDKTEQQIIHLCEVGMTARDSASLSVQIDSISASLQSSDIGFSHADVSQIFDDEAAPPLLSGASRIPPALKE
ncbi:MAG TPA: hypothetical protein VHM91_22020 [Verrucomicrobiales bacterium]|nr:hypothetical protein [Verrucomicrobiales bacterium]